MWPDSRRAAIRDSPVMNSQIKSVSTDHRWWWNGINPKLESNCAYVYVHACMSKVALEAEMKIDPTYVYWMYLSLQCWAHPPRINILCSLLVVMQTYLLSLHAESPIRST